MKNYLNKFTFTLALKLNLLLNTTIFCWLLVSAFSSLPTIIFLSVFLAAPLIYFFVFFFRRDKFINTRNYPNHFSVVVSYLFAMIFASIFFHYDWKNFQFFSLNFLMLSSFFTFTIELIIQISVISRTNSRAS